MVCTTFYMICNVAMWNEENFGWVGDLGPTHVIGIADHVKVPREHNERDAA